MKLARQHHRRVRQLWQECQVAGAPDPARLTAAIAQVWAQRRRDAEPVLRGLLQRLVGYRRRHRVRIVGALPPDRAQVEGVLAGLGAAARSPAGMEVATDPALIAGLRLEVGYEVVDASLARQIELLKARLTAGG